jgi:hypothetical protein
MVTVEVPTIPTPVVPFEAVRRLPATRAVVVESPLQPTVPDVVIVPPVNGVEKVREDSVAFEVLQVAQVNVPPVPIIVIEPPRGEEIVTVDVATVPKRAGVAVVVVHHAKFPTTGTEEVPTFPVPPLEAGHEVLQTVPIQTLVPEMTVVEALPNVCNPVQV